MHLLLEDYYLIRIAYHASSMAEGDADIYDFMTLLVESERTKDLEELPAAKRTEVIEFRTDMMMFVAMPPSCVSDREFTWEEYLVLKDSNKFVFISDEDIETDHPIEADIEKFLVTLRPFLEPQLKRSWEMATRESEFM